MRKIVKRIKRTIAISLVLGMVIQCIPAEAYARNIYNEVDNTNRINTDIKSGNSNNNIKLEYTETDSWNNYVNANVTLNNTSSDDFSIWSVVLKIDGIIETIWNADIQDTVQNNDGSYTYLISSKNYNSTIPGSQSISFGFIAYGTDNKPSEPSILEFWDGTPINTEIDESETINDKEEVSSLTDASDGDAEEGGLNDENEENADTKEGREYAIQDEWKGLEYALFTSGDNGENFYVNNARITGSVHTNGDFGFQGNSISIKGVLEASKGITLRTSDMENSQAIEAKLDNAEKIDMPDIGLAIHEKIQEDYDAQENWTIYSGDKYFNNSDVSLDKNIYAEGSIGFNASTFASSGIIIARNSITYSVGQASTEEGKSIFISSEEGDITLNGSNINLDAVLYAPKGTVYVNANEFHLNGRIIADSVVINGTLIDINAGDHDYDMLEDLGIFIHEAFIEIDSRKDFESEEESVASIEETSAPAFKDTYVNEAMYASFTDAAYDPAKLILEKDDVNETSFSKNYKFAGISVDEEFEGSKENASSKYNGNFTINLTPGASHINEVNYSKGHAYAISDETLLWDDAKQACEDMGGYLVVIDSEEENDLICDLAKDAGKDGYLALGYSDAENEGRWIWVNGSNNGYTNWNGGEPNNGLGWNHQNHAYMYSSGKWDDGYDGTSSYYVCEWDDVEDIATSSVSNVIVKITLDKDTEIVDETDANNIEKNYDVYTTETGDKILVWKTSLDKAVSLELPVKIKNLSDGKAVIKDICVFYNENNKVKSQCLDDIKINTDVYKKSGSWSKIVDSKQKGAVWTYFDTTALYPNDAGIKLYAYATDDLEELTDSSPSGKNEIKEEDINSEEGITGIEGRYLYLEADLSASSENRTPAIDYIKVGANTDIRPQVKELAIYEGYIEGKDKVNINEEVKYSLKTLCNKEIKEDVEWLLDGQRVEGEEAGKTSLYVAFDTVGSHSIKANYKDSNSTVFEKSIEVYDNNEHVDIDTLTSSMLDIPFFNISLDKTSYISGDDVLVTTDIDSQNVVEIVLDGVEYSTEVTEGVFTLIDVTEGEHSVKVTATNEAGNKYTRVIKFPVYGSLPDIKTWFDKEQYYQGDDVILYVEDSYSISSCKLDALDDDVTISDNESSEDGAGESVIFKQPSSGLHNIELKVKDENEEETILSLYLYINDAKRAFDFDRTVPIALITSPKAGEELCDVLRVNGTAKDESELDYYKLLYKNEEDSEYKLIAEGFDNKTDELLGELDISEFEVGTYDIRLEVRDKAGNASYSSIQIFIEEEPGEEYIISGAITSIVLNGESIDIYGRADAEGYLKKYEVSIQKEGPVEPEIIAEGNEEFDTKRIASIPTSDLSDGKYYVILCVEDVTGTSLLCRASFEYTAGTQPDETSINADTSDSDAQTDGNKESDINEEEDEKQKFEIILSKYRAAIGSEVKAEIKLEDGMSQDDIKVYLNDKLISEGETEAVFTSEEAGHFVVKAVYGENDNISTATDASEVEYEEESEIAKWVSAECVFYDPTDKTAPTAEITSPDFNNSILVPTEIIGSAYDESGAVFWRLEYREKGEKDYILLKEGNEDIKDSTFATLDPTMMINGKYELRLTVQDKGGNTKKVSNDFVIEGNLKVGNMHIGFTDVNTTIGGTNLTINRIYDSRNKKSDDFGYGWSMGVTDIRLTESHSLDDGYTMTKTGSVFSTMYRLQENVSHDVIVTYGDGRSDRFSLVIIDGISALVPVSEISLAYKCVTNQKVKLEILADTTAYYEGGQVVFLDDSIYDTLNYRLTTEDGNKIYLNKSKGVYKIETSSGDTITVDKNGYHASNGKSVEFIRDSKGRVAQITEPDGDITVYSYDENGDLVSVTDPAERTVSYTYDSNHNLISIIDPTGAAISRNEYDDEGRLIATIDADGNRMEFDHDIDGRQEVIRDRKGYPTVYLYDDNGNILKTTDALGNVTENTYDTYNNCISGTDANGHTTKYEYDTNGNVTKVIAADGTAITSTYSESNYVTGVKLLDKTVIAMTYNDSGLITSVSDANGNTKEYTYNSDKKLTGMTDAIGEYLKMTYDNDGNVVSTTNGAGECTYYTYDEKNRCSGVTIKRVEDGKEVSFTSRYTYDDSDNIIQSVDNAGNVTTYEYDENGNRVASVDAKNRRISYEYDKQSNLVKTVYPDGTYESFEYDANGNNVTAVDRSGLKVTMAYDKLNRMVSKTYADGTKESYNYDGVGNVTEKISVTGAKTTYSYDECNRNISITDAFGSTTTFEYDNQSRIISKTDVKNNKISYDYDDNGNIIKTTYPDGNSVTATYDARNRMITQTDQNGNTTSYEYDGADKLTKVTDAYGNSFSYSYDENGNLIKVTDALSHSTEYSYDEVGRVSSVKNAAGNVAEYIYDSTGQLISEKDFSGNETIYSYDDMDRVIRKKLVDNDIKFEYTEEGLINSVSDKSGTVEFEYDKYNRLVSYTDANNITVKYSYDKYGNTQSVDNGFNKTQYEYDTLNRLTRVIDHNGKATLYEYDELGNRSAVRYPNGTVMSYTYDECQRLTEELVTDSSGKQLARYSYGLGKAGERLSVTEEELSPDSSSNNTQIIKTEIDYSYDKLNRLTKETISRSGSKLVQEYTYDTVSNRLSQTVSVTGDITDIADTNLDEIDIKTGTTVYSYNELNQLVSEENGSETTTYLYDNNGNLIKQTGLKNNEYTYDSENRLLSATVQQGGNQTVEEYTYDYAGNRTSKVTNTDGITRYINDINADLTYVLGETDEDRNLKRSYTRGQELISVESNGQTSDVHYFIYDGHDSTRILTDDSGDVTDRYSYDGYGNLLEKEGDTQNDFLYTGEQYNYTTELYYLRARYMSTSTGTFISMDSYAGSLSDPVTLHKYLYANANPVMNSDPSGFMSISELATRMGIDISQKSSEAIRNAILVRTLKRALAGAIAGAVFSGVDSYLSGNSMSGVIKDAFIGSLCGFGIGALLYVAMIYATVSVPVYITLHIFKYGILLAGGLGVPIALDEENGKLALFRAITTLVGYIGFSKALSGIKCEPLIKGESGTTKLYRSMSQAEYDSVIKNQKFVPYDLAMEDKWFATTQENATKWGDIFYPDGNYRIIEVEVDTNSLNKMYHVDYLDNIGPAYCSPLDILEESIRSIKGVTNYK